MSQVAAGREWFIHTIYTLRSRENANRGIGKRSLEYHHAVSSVSSEADNLPQSRRRRSAPDADALDIGFENNRGTNIQHIALDRADRIRVSQRQPWALEPGVSHERPLVEGSLGREPDSDWGLPVGMSTLLGLVGLLLLLCLVVLLVVLLVRRKRKEKKQPPYSTSSSAAYRDTGSSYQGMTSAWQRSDSSEV